MPPVIVEAHLRHNGQKLRFSDVDGGWADAQRQSTGYAAGEIVNRVAAATREVFAGRALYERDSVLFYEPDYPFPIVAALLHAALAHGGNLTVIDYGGSLGSTYRQCRPMLRHIPSLRWHVIEQAHFVEIGRSEFGTEQLLFWPSVHDLPPLPGPSFLLISSVLQYLEEPEAILAVLLGLNASHLIIDRTPMSADSVSRLCIQHVPPSIYQARYPCWVLSRPRLRSVLATSGWQVTAELLNTEGTYSTPSGFGFEFRGLLAERRTEAS